ncbi:MAG TPA: SHOCT domain-containing protein [Solirubrobacterales bacterium]|nr:SHOCT domain-containing protein [Solirubrobacterales bacterium]
MIACLALTATLAGAGVASANPQEEKQGSQILGELESGKLECGEASPADFELVGEYAMGRMFGSPSQHEAMNQIMSRMMGARGEESVHEAMGRRFSGCGGGQLPAGFGRMMGAVNALGMMGGGMMGGASQGGRSYGGYGGMMGGYGSSASTNDDDFDGPSAAAMVGMMAVLIGAVALAVFLLARRRPGGPLDTLERRYASGELSAEDYQERKRLLEGS